MISLERVSKKYGTRLAVNKLSLEVPGGEVFAFLGPNGAGKTTTIKMMVGLLNPSEGRIRLNGYDVMTEPRQARQALGFVPDQPDLYEKLTGCEFLQFVARMHGLSPEESSRRRQQLTEVFELHEFHDRLAESYSHGMKQRVAFAAALIHRPAVLVLDEPMVGLDPRTTRTVKNLMRTEAREGTTVFMSTHSLPIAEEVADRIGVIHGGELLFLGTLDDLRRSVPDLGGNFEELFLHLTEARNAPGEDAPV